MFEQATIEGGKEEWRVWVGSALWLIAEIISHVEKSLRGEKI